MIINPVRKTKPQMIINPVRKLVFTDVWSLRTGRVVATYSLPPRQAVLHAYLQLGRANYNFDTYDYVIKRDDVKVVEAGSSFICVDYWAKKK
jgi:hypothetical protein